MSKQFDPSSIGLLNGNLYGLPHSIKEAKIIVIPVPWDVTVSYREGSWEGPQTMLDASAQVDLFDADIKDAWKLGIAMEPIPKSLMKKNVSLRKLAIKCIENLENGGSERDVIMAKNYAAINSGCEEMNAWVKSTAKKYLKQDKQVCVLGGEHSVSLGLLQTLTEKHKEFSILHIDAHADLREAYEGFQYSHASIMFNALKFPNVKKMAVVGIRDYSQQEADRINNSKGRITAFPDKDIKYSLYRGETWHTTCENIVKTLGDKVYLSFDIDALDPSLCPHTGTPVPGGLEYDQVFYLIEHLISKDKNIIGFDLSEVAPGIITPQTIHSWDTIVGARALYRLINLMAKSQNLHQ